jgi:hypothetical protein
MRRPLERVDTLSEFVSRERFDCLKPTRYVRVHLEDIGAAPVQLMMIGYSPQNGFVLILFDVLLRCLLIGLTQLRLDIEDRGSDRGQIVRGTRNADRILVHEDFPKQLFRDQVNVMRKTVTDRENSKKGLTSISTPTAFAAPLMISKRGVGRSSSVVTK